MSLPALIVPARLGSTRFPRKLLQEFRGRPLIVAVGERIREQAPEYPLIFAVDGEELESVLKLRGFDAVITDPDHPSGTDRIAEVARSRQLQQVINVQGDEPLVLREHIVLLTQLLQRGEAPMVTLATAFCKGEDPRNPNAVKVVINQKGKALYFSRALIPFDRDVAQDAVHSLPFYRHLGLYGFTGDFLQRFTQLPSSVLEQREKLEQLRALDHGYDILVGITEQGTVGIDTPEDFARLHH